MKFYKLVLVSLLSCCLLACGQEKEENNLVVATSADNPPYELITEGKIVGLDIDIINAIAERLNRKLVLKNLDFHGLLASLGTNNVDAVIAGLSVTPQRLEIVDFTEIYTSANVALLYRKGDNITKEQDLADKIVGAQLGTIWQQIADDFKVNFNSKVHLLATNLMLVQELKSKSVDALILEEAQAKQFAANYPEFAYFSLKDKSSEFAIALPKNSDLKNQINEVIRAMREDGTLDKIKKKWLE